MLTPEQETMINEIVASTRRTFVTSGGDGDATGGGPYLAGSAIEETGGDE